jgi:O-succinylbenzoate synthase
VAFGVSCALAELAGELPEAADYRAAPLCTGDPDALVVQLAGMAGEKVAKVKVGLYEAVRDGMVVNLLLEAIPDLRLRLDANRAWTPLKAQQFAKYVNPLHRSASPLLRSPVGPARRRALSPAKPASPSPGTKACARPILPLRRKRACGRWSSSRP